MNYNLSEYQINKRDKNALVSPDALGNLHRITRDDFSSDEEFQFWKNWNDDNLHEIEKGHYVYYAHNTSLSPFEHSDKLATPSCEEELLFQEETLRDIKEMKQFLYLFRASLTETQLRRCWLYWVDGKTIPAIASLENVRQEAVRQSIYQAQAILKPFVNFLKNSKKQ